MLEMSKGQCTGIELLDKDKVNLPARPLLIVPPVQPFYFYPGPLTLVQVVFYNSLKKMSLQIECGLFLSPLCVFQINSVSPPFREEIYISFHV